MNKFLRMARKHAVAGAAFVLLIAVGGGCSSVGLGILGGPTVRMSKPKVIVRADTAYGWGFLTHVSLAQYSPGVVVVSCFLEGEIPVGIPERLKVRRPIATFDGGETWYNGEEAQRRFPGDMTNVVMAPSSIRGTNEFVTFKWENRIRNGRGAAPVSVWDYSGRLVGSGVGRFACPTGEGFLADTEIYLSNHGVEAADGRKYVVGYGKMKAKETYRAILLRLDEPLSTWTFVSTIASPEDFSRGEGPNECALAVFPDGEMLALVRTGGNTGAQQGGSGNSMPMLSCRSKDGGKTWEISRTVPGVMPKLLLMSNGVLVLTTGRPGNVLYFSTNRGKSWSRSISLSPASDQSSGYCDSVEIAPGRLLVVYDTFNTTEQKVWLWEPKRVNVLYQRYVDVTP